MNTNNIELFPKELMFDVVRDQDCISLQKDGDIPDWMEKPSLETWNNTRNEISRCDLVITSSCTSVAHLAGAMGIKTFIVVPILSILSYGLYPVNTTPYYDSVTLFRQEKYGSNGKNHLRKLKNLYPQRILKNRENFVLTGSLPDPVFM